MIQQIREDQNGFALPTVVIFGLAFLLIIISVSELSVTNFVIAQNNMERLHARMAADAGLDFAVSQLNQDDTWTGTSGEDSLFTGSNYEVTFEVVVTDIDDDNKTIRSTGHFYEPNTASTPEVSVTYESNLRALQTGGNFSVVTGVGGLYMSNNSKIVAGDVQVNGEIVMNNSAQIGLSTNSLLVQAAHQNCPNPPDSNYPRICNSGENGEPIEINNNAQIYGDVSANNQIDGSGMSNSGLVASSGVTTEPLPPHDRTAQQSAVAYTRDSSWADCNANETRNWPADLHITGDLNVGSQCQIYISGDVWIDGNVNLSQQAELIVDESLGSTIPTIMIDGNSGLNMENRSRLLSNSFDTGFRVVTYYSEASCSPDCSDVSGQDLFDSRQVETIRMQNNTEAPESLLYAKWTQISISNAGDIGALAGQTVELTNSATITFGTSTGGGSGNKTWLIDSYNKVFN